MPPYDPRQDITDQLMQQQGASPLAYGMAGLGAGYGGASPMTGPTLQGLPQTPAGGVPGAGIGAAGPSSLSLPPQRGGVQGAMPGMPSMGSVGGGAPAMPGMGALGAGMGGVGGMPPPPRPGMLGDMSGTGQMSDFENAAAGPRMGRRRGY